MSEDSEEQKLEQRLKNLEIKVLENYFDANSLGNLARNIKDYEGISEERKEQSLILIYDNFSVRFPKQFGKFYGSKSKIAIDALSPLYEEVQKIYDFSKNTFQSAPVFQRSELNFGQILEGPLLIQETDTTIVVPEGFYVTPLAGGHLMLEQK